MIESHPEITIQKLNIGNELLPLLVIDNVVADPEYLVDLAAGKNYGKVAALYPGVRAKAPLSYQQFITGTFSSLFREHFGLHGRTLRFTSCHFSLVTRAPADLDYLQRIPHIDSLSGDNLAMIHYLFKSDLGGTAFYRHRRTGFESVGMERNAEYLRWILQENTGADQPAATYINGDTPLYLQVARQEARFNRMLVYRRNMLHSGSLDPGFTPDPNPRTGRLSLNGFLA